MKNLILTLLLLAPCLNSFGQTNAYQLWISTTNGDSGWQFKPPSNVVPDQYWQNAVSVAFHSAFSNEMSVDVSNAVASALSNTNLSFIPNWSAYTNMIAQIPAGINDTSNRIVTLTGLQSSINSGTNSQPQLNSIMAQMALQIKFSYVYLSNLIVLRSYEQTIFH